MPYGAHRQTDARVCGGKTKVVGQSTVFVNDKLWAVKDDVILTHSGGELIPTGTTIFVENKLIIAHTPDQAKPDSLCSEDGDITHCNPMTAEGSSDTLVY
jgi:hypothetical protein